VFVEMASSMGIMDSAYFVGRNQILTWTNSSSTSIPTASRR